MTTTDHARERELIDAHPWEGLVAMTTYTVVCERSDGWWAVTVPEAPGVFTQARRLDHVEAMGREAIALMLDVPADSLDIKVAWTVPPASA